MHPKLSPLVPYPHITFPYGNMSSTIFFPLIQCHYRPGRPPPHLGFTQGRRLQQVVSSQSSARSPKEKMCFAYKRRPCRGTGRFCSNVVGRQREQEGISEL